MALAVERLRELLRIPTISFVDESRTDWSRFEELADALARLYPLVHERLEREVVADRSLLYRWRGRDAADPLVLLAHLDVVDVVEGEWEHPPFAAELIGEGEDAAVFARGAIDDKGAVAAIFEAIEGLLAEGFAPAHDVLVALGHDEETSGGGAHAIAELLERRGVRPGLVLDEGGAVVDGVIPAVGASTAMIGVAERGHAFLRLSVQDTGGHASTPPPLPATARLARAIHRLHRRPFPRRLTPPVRAMLATIAPYAPGPLRVVLRRLRIAGPFVAWYLSRIGVETNALVRTTAVVTALSGAAGDNVLPTTAEARLDVRLLLGDTVDAVTRRIRRIVGDDRVSVSLRRGAEPSPVSPWKGAAWRRIARAMPALGGQVVATPYVQLGASDSRWFAGLTPHVYRFTPFHLTQSERDALHAHDERIRVDVWLRGIAFYRALVEAS